MRTQTTRRTGNTAFIEAAPSTRTRGMMHFSAPPISELTKDQTQALINMLTTVHREMWGNERGN